MPRERASPTLNDFLVRRFEPWAKARFENNAPETWHWYRTAMRAVLQYKPLASAPLDQITTEKIAEFAAHRQALKMRISSVNNTLRALRRMLRLAVEWGALAISTSSRYVHPSDDAVLTAMSRLAGHNFGHSVLG